MPTDTNIRLRSEATPSASRSQRLIANRVVATARRERIASQFRASLLTELGVETLSASQGALVDAAASAYTEIQELSALYLRCAADEAQMTRLGRARSELGRTLRLLGLPRLSDEASNSAGPNGLAAYLSGRTRQPDAIPEQLEGDDGNGSGEL